MIDDPAVSDEQCIQLLASGATRGLELLAARYEQPMLGLARGLLGGRDDLARDAVQDAWVRLIRFAAKFDARSRVKTWLYTILVHRCRDLRPARGGGDPGDPESRAGPSADPPHEMELCERAARVRSAVESLPADRRALVLLCYHAGMTHEEAASVLNLPLGTLKSRLSATLRALRESLSREAAR